MRRSLLLVIFLGTVCFAAQPRYHFIVPNGQLRFTHLTTILRCLVCQNENLAQSQAKLADDLRKDIVKQINAGKTDAEIKDYMVDRYGQFVLYEPTFSAGNLFLWLGPGLFFVIGLLILFFTIRKKS